MIDMHDAQLCSSPTRHTSHVTRHTPHVTRHTSHVTRHTSHVTRYTSHVTRHLSRLLQAPWYSNHLHSALKRNRVCVMFEAELPKTITFPSAARNDERKQQLHVRHCSTRLLDSTPMFCKSTSPMPRVTGVPRLHVPRAAGRGAREQEHGKT